MGRRPKEISARQVARLASRFCTHAEIAAAVGCSTKTIQRRFVQVVARGRACGQKRLRYLQWKQATKGSTPMLIWLGKQYLDQTDKADLTTTTTVLDPIEAYNLDPDLMERGLQFERDLANAPNSVPIDPGPPGVQGVEVPAPHPTPGSDRNEVAGDSVGQSPDCSDSG